jgi:hypothetical protein
MADSAAAHVPTRSGRVAFESEVVQQPATDAAPAMGGSDISVTDEHDVLDILQTHHPDQMAILLETPEPDPMFDLMPQLRARHVGGLEPVIGDDSLVGLRRVVDHLEDLIEILIGAWPDHVSHR